MLSAFLRLDLSDWRANRIWRATSAEQGRQSSIKLATELLSPDLRLRVTMGRFSLSGIEMQQTSPRATSRNEPGAQINAKGDAMMSNFTKILCPVDFDRNSAAALRFACQLLELGGTLYLLHVVSEADHPGFEQYPPISELARQNLENFACTQIGDQIIRKLLVRAGDPATLTVRVAAEFAVDLIVMATHGHKGLVRVVLGSVAERVLRDAKCPVLTLRPGAPAQPAAA